MGVFDYIQKKREKFIDKKYHFKEMLKSGGKPVAFGNAKYLGGHPDILGEKDGNITINSLGIFFSITLTFNYIFIPVEKISQSEFKTGEQISKNEIFSRLLALGGFSFAFKKKSRDKYMYLTITYEENGIENTVLFETKYASKFASAIAKIRQDCPKDKSSNNGVSTTELIKQISELKALSILTEAEFTEKKKELLSRM